MLKRNIIVVGASAGGVEELKKLVTCLPKDFDGSMFIVLHIPAYSPSSLPHILSRCNVFEVLHPKDGEKIQPKKIYVAPPNHHLLIEKNTVLIKKGPKENRFRPSIDALFRSAAYTFGSRVIGIILSGTLDDGTSGMWTIKRLGGLAIVQLPSEASHPEMPMNVMEFVDVDHCISVENMCDQIGYAEEKPIAPKDAVTKTEIEILELEIAIPKHNNAFALSIIDQGALTSFTCPECNGSLIRLVEGKIIRFRCHAGHGFTASALLAALTQHIEDSLVVSMRAMEECTRLLKNLSNNYRSIGQHDAADFFGNAEEENRQRATVIHESIFSQKALSADFRFLQKVKEPAAGTSKKKKKNKE